MKRWKISIRPGFFLYICAIALLSSVQTCFSAITALFVHETAHSLAALCLKEPVLSIRITPFGGVMTAKPGTSFSKGIKGVILSAAGPAGNYAMIWLLSQTMVIRILGKTMCAQMIQAHTVMMLLNLIPALPLDGGGIVFSLGYYVFGIVGLLNALCALGVLTGASMIAIGLYGLIMANRLNLTLPIIGVYLIVSALRSKNAMLIQNVYDVLMEQPQAKHGIRRLKTYQVSQDEQLCHLLRHVADPNGALFLVEDRSGIHLLSSSALSRYMLKDPTATVQSLLSESRKTPDQAYKRIHEFTRNA